MCGWAGAGNVGDELLTAVVVDRLRSGGAVPVVVSRDPEATAGLHGVEAVPWGPRGWSRIRAVDAVCIGPGGLLQDSSSVWSLPGNLALPLVCRRRGATLAAVGVGAEPLRRRSSRRLLRRVLGEAPVVTRDEASTAALVDAGLVATTAADLVFALEPPKVTRRREILVAVGPSVRPGRVAPAARRLQPAPVGAIVSALDHLAGVLDCELVLTGFRGGRDVATAHEIASTTHARHRMLEGDAATHVEHIAGARLVVSSRYHPVVLAARCGTPAAVVSQQAKVRSLVDQISSPLVTRFETWGAIGEVADWPPTGEPVVPQGITAALASVDTLVASLAPRGEPPSD